MAYLVAYSSSVYNKTHHFLCACVSGIIDLGNDSVFGNSHVRRTCWLSPSVAAAEEFLIICVTSLWVANMLTISSLFSILAKE